MLFRSNVFLLLGIRAYEELGFRAFGTPGKMAAGIAITLQNIGGELVCAGEASAFLSLQLPSHWDG